MSTKTGQDWDEIMEGAEGDVIAAELSLMIAHELVTAALDKVAEARQTLENMKELRKHSEERNG
jgi:hypothetical protein